MQTWCHHSRILGKHYCSRLRFQVQNKCYKQLFLDSLIQFECVILNIIGFVCLCQLIFLCEVYYIFGVIQLIQDCTLVKQCCTKHMQCCLNLLNWAGDLCSLRCQGKALHLNGSYF